MKKICFVTTVYITYKSFLKQFSEYLYKTGEYDISLICNNEPGLKEDLPSFVHYYPVEMKRGVSLSAINAVKKIAKVLKENQFDIVQYSTPNAAFYTSIAAKKQKVPVRLYCQWGIRYMGFNGWKRSLFKFFEKITCNNSTFIEAESHNIRRFSIQEGLYSRDESCVVWNGSACGVDSGKFNIENKAIWRAELHQKYHVQDYEVVFSFAGRLTADKGVNELLEAFLNLSAKIKNIKLMIIGGADNLASLDKNLFEKAKVSKNIIFIGNVQDIERYYAAADVFVAPSYREGFGLVVVEAQAMGLPAIVSDVPGQVDAIKPEVTGLLCQVKNAQSLEQAMEKLATDSAYREKLGISAAKFAKEEFEQKRLFSYLRQHRDSLIFGGKENA